MPKDANYILSVGEKFVGRLMRLNDFSQPFSSDFLRRNGLKSGDHVIDVGCGIGEFTCWLAEQVGPKGRVVAIDISVEQLDIARRTAKNKNLSNIEFHVMSIYDLAQLNTEFDLVYSRYVVDHLVEKERAIQIMSTLVRRGGVLCCESSAVNTRSAFSYPMVPARDTLHQWFDSLRRLTVYSSELGFRLPAMLREAGLEKISIDLVQPALKTHYHREHELLLLDECCELFITQGIASQSEIDTVRQSISAAIINEKIDFFWFLIAQVSAQKMS